jgi:outer membrane biosynthesis protein TonB
MKAPVIKFSLNHPIVLYFVLLVALANLLYLSVAGKYEFAAIFVMVGFLTSFFSKNMTVIMVVAIVATSVLQFGGVAGVEGMESKEPEKEEKKEEEVKPEEAKPDEAKPAEDALEKVADKQKDLVDKIEKMEPALKQIETFVERLGKFADYK